MSQSEYMKEAERLIAAHTEAVFRCEGGDEETLAALLAHIQRGNHSYTIGDIPPRIWDDEKKQYKYLKVPSVEQLWNNDEVMALNAELGLTMDQISRLVRAALHGEEK